MPSLKLRRLEARFSGLGPGIALGVCVIAGGLALGLTYARDASGPLDTVGRLAGFELKRVTVSGQTHTSDSALVAAMGLAPGATLLGLDVEAARDRLMALPWVSEVAVRKVLPGSLDVSVSEAEPFARWSDGGGVRLIAADGRVLADTVPPDFRALPLVAGRGADERVGEAVELMETEPDVRAMTAAAILVNERRWDLRLTSGATARLSATDPAGSLRRLLEMSRTGALQSMGRAVIDLRLPERTVVALVTEGEAAPDALPAEVDDPLAAMIAEGQFADDPLARAIAEAAL